MDLPSAVAAPRWHQQWLPDEAQFEAVRDPAYQPLMEKLRAMGHKIDPESESQGDAHSILIEFHTGSMIGVADHRISGQAARVPPPHATEEIPSGKVPETVTPGNR